jgi:hypothetical protein
MKIRTISKLQEKLDSDLSWRKKELINMRMIIQQTGDPMLIRAGIALLSAHFEGFLKLAANYYIVYISDQGIKTNRLKKSFLALKCKSKFKSCTNTEKTSAHTSLIEDLVSQQANNFHLKYTNEKPPISTESNPSSDVFQEILKTISLDFSPYEIKSKYIDSDLLKNRNDIVHGQKCYVIAADYYNTFDRITEIMDQLNAQIIEAANNQEYLQI